MFTGIVEEMGVAVNVDFSGNVNKIRIRCKKTLENIKLGDSIAVNGICLTVSNFGSEWFEADVMPETLRKTSLSDIQAGSHVNLEPALRLGGRLGGHIVSGHIDGIGIIKQVKAEKNAVWLIIEAPSDIMKYIVMKGSIAIEGTSLTVAYIGKEEFGISLIPATRNVTILGNKKAGDAVNIECDIIGKYIEKLMKPEEGATIKQKSSVDMTFLQQAGFI